MNGLIAPAINLAILVGALVYYLRLPLANFVRQRHETLRSDLQQVSEQLRDAQLKYSEFTAKLKAIDAEVSAIRDQMRQDGESAKQRILSEARRLSVSIVTDARSASVNLFSDLREQLRSELGLRVLERAEKLLTERLTGDDRIRIRREFSQQVEKFQ